MNSTWEDERSEGLVVIGVTDEPPSLVDGWVEDLQPDYPIVSLRGDEFERFLGVEYFPTAAVIDPGGILTYAGSAGSYGSALEEALGAAEGPLYPKSLDKVTKLLWKKDPCGSYAELLKLFEKGKLEGEDLAAAEALKSYLEGLVSSALERARALVEEGKLYHALGEVEEFSKAKTPFPASPDVAALLEKMEGMPDYKKELRGGKDFVEAEALEKDTEFLEAFNGFRSVWKKYGGTRIAEHAKARALAIQEAGSAGWRSTCNDCRKSREMRACEKHAEKVEL